MGYTLNSRKWEDSPKSAIDAALDMDALFTPQVTGTILPNGTVSDKTFTIYRELSNGEQVELNSGVRRGYHAESYHHLLEIAEAMFPNSTTGMQVYDEGAMLVFTQQVAEPYTFGDGDLMVSNIMYTASLNSTLPSAATGFSFRPFCTNQLGLGQLQFSQKRTKNHDRLMFDKAKVMAEAAGQFDALISNAKVLKGLRMDKFLLRRTLDEVAPLLDEEANAKARSHAEKRREGILYFYAEEVEKFGENAWALYQAVQSYEFHTVAGSGKGTELKQVRVVTEPEKAQRLTSLAEQVMLARV